MTAFALIYGMVMGAIIGGAVVWKIRDRECTRCMTNEVMDAWDKFTEWLSGRAGGR